MRRHHLIAVVALAALALGACASSGERRPVSLREDALPPGSLTGEVVFVRAVDEDRSVLLRVDLASGEEETFLNPGGLATSPEWSRDGSKLAFAVTDPDTGVSHIWTVNADGSDAKAVTKGDVVDDYPTWSPDGSEIIFSSLRSGNMWRLHRMKADGSDVRRITNGPGEDVYPSWSPAGDAVAFSRREGETYNLYVVDPGGGEARRATESAGDDLYADFSPDGNKIVFSSTRDEVTQIYVLDVATNDQTALVPSDTVDYYPRFSPDGAHVVFTAGHLAVYRADGENISGGTVRWALTEETGEAPAWRPAR